MANDEYDNRKTDKEILERLEKENARVVFDCPFCKGSFSVNTIAVLHTMPPCNEFLEKDCLTFVHDARMILVGPQPDDHLWPIPKGKKDAAT